MHSLTLRSLAALVLGAVYTAGTVHAADNPYWNFSAYGTQDPKALLQASVDSESPAEKLRIRSYLAAKAGNTAEGLAARAWMADYQGHGTEAKRLYLDCVERFPKMALCLNNAVNAAPSDMSLRQRYLELDPMVFDFAAVRLMFTSLGEKGQAAEQKAFLARMLQQYPNQWIASYLQAMQAAEQGDRSAQRAALERSIAVGDKPPFFVYKELIDLLTGHFYEGGSGRMELASELVVKYLMTTRRFGEYEPWEYLMNQFAADNGGKVAVLRQFVDIYDRFGVKGQVRPIPAEALDAVVSRGEVNVHRTLGPWLQQFRQRFAARRTSEPLVATSLLWFETATDGNLPSLLPQWQQLVTNAFATKHAVNMASSALGALLQLRADCSAANELAKQWDTLLGQQVDFQSTALDAALCANDLAGARQRVDAVARLTISQSAAIRSDRMRVALAEAQTKAWTEQERKNPFLKRWDQSNGGRVALNIEFATGSAVVPPRYAEQLTQLAGLLKDNGANDYQFDIAGHTDARGNGALNQRLSEQRAQAVVDHLIDKAGIERGRLSASGYGSTFPVASNANDAGMQQNRRVEITPRANLRTPQLAQEGSPYGLSVVSPDGRVLATPTALWDLKTRLKLRDLPAGEVRQADFLPSGRTIVRLVDLKWPGSPERALELVDVASGLLMRRVLLVGGGAESYAVSPDGNRLVMLTNGHLQIYSLPALALKQQRMLSVLASVGRVTWMGNERIAAAVRFGGEHLHVLDASTLAIRKTFEEINYVHTLGASPGGKYLTAITNDGRLHTWEGAAWQHREMQLGVFADRFVFHPFEEKVLINQWNGSDRKTRLIDLEKLVVLKKFDQNHPTASFFPDGKRFMTGGLEHDFTSLDNKPWPGASAGAGSAYLAAWSPGTGQLVTKDDVGAQFWDVATGRLIDRMVDLHLCGQVAGTAGKYLWQCKDKGEDTMVEMGTWRRVPNPTAFERQEGQSVELKTANRTVVFEHDAAPSKGRVAKRGRLRILERSSGQVLATHPVLLRPEDPVYSNDDALHGGGVSVTVDPTGRYAAMRVWWKEHWGYPALSSKWVWLYDLQTGQALDKLELSGRAESLAFAPGNEPRLRVGFDDHTGVYDLQKKAWDNHESWSAKETLWAESGSWRLVGLDNKLTLLGAQGAEHHLFARGSLAGAAIYPDQNLLLLYMGGGEFDYYDLKTLNRQLTLHVKPRGEWLSYAPSGEFAGSLKGPEGYYWALGDKYLPFSALRERFERPDLIARQLQSVIRGTASAPTALVATSLRQDAAAASGSLVLPVVDASSRPAGAAPTIEADLFLPPFALRIVEAPTKSREPGVTVKVGVTRLRPIQADPEIELNLNGQQMKSRGLGRITPGSCDPKTVNCEQVVDVPVNLDDGRNVVQVSLLYRNARLETKTAVVELDRPRQAGAAAPRLWLFAAGVSQYADAKQNLQFAHRDAEELAKALKGQEGKLYSQVNTKVLTNAQVAKGSLDTEINRFLRQASEQDLIVVLLAGHGVQDNDQTLYFMTHDAQVDEPFSGLDVARIRNILRSRPPNQKALLLLDICHAGALGEGRRGSVSAEDAIKQLSQGTGVMVLSSSTGRELSNEGAQYRGGHGAFTAAVLEGLEGAADSQAGNRDGVVSLQELTTFVMRRVPELTRNAQHPTTPSTERLQDFPVAVRP